MGVTPMFDRDDDGNEFLRIPLLGRTRERLERVCQLVGDQPEHIAASLLHDILKDDAEAHGEIPRHMVN